MYLETAAGDAETCAQRGRGCQEGGEGPEAARTGMKVSSQEIKITSSPARGGPGLRPSAEDVFWAATVCSPLGSHRARLFSGQDLWSSDPSLPTKTTRRQGCSGRGGAQARRQGGDTGPACVQGGRQPRSGRWALAPALGPAVPTLGPGAASGKTRRGVGRASAGRTVSARTPCETLSAVTRASAFALPRAGLHGGWFLARTAWDTVVTLPLS